MPISTPAVPDEPAGAACIIINIGGLDIWAADFPLKSDGRGDWIRTSDLHTPSVMRYQAALRPDLAGASRQGHHSRQGAAEGKWLGDGGKPGRGGGLDGC